MSEWKSEDNDDFNLDRLDMLLTALFPKQPNFRIRWLFSPNKAFDGFTPSEVIHSAGIKKVIKYLESHLGH